MAKCRACLVKSENMMLFNENSVSTFNLLTNILVREDDGLPQHLCKTCYDIINDFGNFRERCISIDTALRNDLCQIEIKAENLGNGCIKTEEGYDNDNYYGEEYLVDNDEGDKESLVHILKNEDKCDNQLIERPKYSTRLLKKKTRKKTVENFIANIEKYDKAKPQKNHQRKKGADKNNQYGCGLCPRIFGSEEECNKHISGHKGENWCSICDQNFKSWWQTLAHRAVHEKRGKFCYVCGKRFMAVYSLEFHYRKAHAGEENVLLECNQCSRMYKSPLKLTKHKRSTHSTKTFICDYCQKVFTNKHSMSTHIKMHVNAKLVTCKLCDYSCNLLTNLKTHILYKHTADKVYCETCQSWYKDQETLNRHKCTARRRQICPICGKKCTRLKRHMVSHTEVGEFKCDRCPAVYKNKSTLREHMDKHDGIRRNQCEFCPMAFHTAAVLFKHRRTHTGVKPYVCSICQRGFIGKYNLKLHMRVHGEDLIKKNRDVKVDIFS